MFSFDFDDPKDWKEMAQLLRKKRGIIFQLIWQTGRRERPPTPTTNGQGNNKNISSPSLLFPYSGVGNLLCPKKSEKLFKGSPVITDEKLLSFSSVPRTKNVSKIWRDKNSASFFAGDQWTSSPPKIFISIIVVSSGGGCSKHLFYCFPPAIYFFLSFFREKDGRQLFSFLISLFCFPKTFWQMSPPFLSLAFCRNIFIRQVIRFHTKTLTIR